MLGMALEVGGRECSCDSIRDSPRNHMNQVVDGTAILTRSAVGCNEQKEASEGRMAINL
jgi:hypothetical protein